MTLSEVVLGGQGGGTALAALRWQPGSAEKRIFLASHDVRAYELTERPMAPRCPRFHAERGTSHVPHYRLHAAKGQPIMKTANRVTSQSTLCEVLSTSWRTARASHTPSSCAGWCVGAELG